jgi:ribonuclease HI
MMHHGESLLKEDWETGNYCELMARKLVLRLALEFGVSQLQISNDSMMVIQWMRKEITLENFTLQPLCDEVHRLLVEFSHISLSSIYTDMNMLTDGLSKVGLGLDQGT